MPLTRNTWQSVNDGNWDNTSNWSLTVKPTTDHVAVFDGTSSISVTTNLDQSGSSFAQLLVTPQNSSNFGSQGNPLQISIGSSVCVMRGRGVMYVAADFGEQAVFVLDVRGNPNREALVIGGIGTGSYANVVAVKSGRCRVEGDVSLGSGVFTLGDAADLRMDANAGGFSDPARIICSAGYCENKRGILSTAKTLIVGDRSRLDQIGALPSTTTVVVIGNGKFRYLPTSAPGTTPVLVLIGGSIDQSEERFDSVWGTVYIGPDAFIKGGTVRGSGLWPPDLDFRDEYPGSQE